MPTASRNADISGADFSRTRWTGQFKDPSIEREYVSQLAGENRKGMLVVSVCALMVTMAVYSTPGGFRGWLAAKLRGLVLGCMDSYDSEKRRIFRDFRDLQDFFAFAPLKPQNSR